MNASFIPSKRSAPPGKRPVLPRMKTDASHKNSASRVDVVVQLQGQPFHYCGTAVHTLNSESAQVFRGTV